jgi:hypothetical protein
MPIHTHKTTNTHSLENKKIWWLSPKPQHQSLTCSIPPGHLSLHGIHFLLLLLLYLNEINIKTFTEKSLKLSRMSYIYMCIYILQKEKVFFHQYTPIPNKTLVNSWRHQTGKIIAVPDTTIYSAQTQLYFRETLLSEGQTKQILNDSCTKHDIGSTTASTPTKPKAKCVNLVRWNQNPFHQ